MAAQNAVNGRNWQRRLTLTNRAAECVNRPERQQGGRKSDRTERRSSGSDQRQALRYEQAYCAVNMNTSTPVAIGFSKRLLLALVLMHAAASLWHFIHNAEFLGDYPNMPPWLSPTKIYLVWLAEALIGATGVVLFLRGRTAGLLVIAVYAVLGLGGLDHYVLAPIAAHTLTMNVTIWLEAATAAAVLVGVGMVFVTKRLAGVRASP